VRWTRDLHGLTHDLDALVRDPGALTRDLDALSLDIWRTVLTPACGLTSGTWSA
jgi:hypothetical protein